MAECLMLSGVTGLARLGGVAHGQRITVNGQRSAECYHQCQHAMKTRITLLACFIFLVGGSLLEWPVYSQRPAAKRAKKGKGGFMARIANFAEMERRGLEP